MTPLKKLRGRHRLPLTLPVRFGLSDGTNAHLLVDARNTVFGNLFGIMHHMTVDEARRTPRCARGVRTAEFIVHAVNAHDTLSIALRKIAATSSHKRIMRIATEALDKAGELPAPNGNGGGK